MKNINMIDLWTKSLKPLLESAELSVIKLAYLLLSVEKKVLFADWVNLASYREKYVELELPVKNIAQTSVGVNLQNWDRDVFIYYRRYTAAESYKTLNMYRNDNTME